MLQEPVNFLVSLKPVKVRYSVACNHKYPDSNTTLKFKLSKHLLLTPVSYPLDFRVSGCFYAYQNTEWLSFTLGWGGRGRFGAVMLLLPLVISSLPGLINTQCLGARKGPQGGALLLERKLTIAASSSTAGWPLSCYTSRLSCPHRHSSEKTNGSVSCVK